MYMTAMKMTVLICALYKCYRETKAFSDVTHLPLFTTPIVQPIQSEFTLGILSTTCPSQVNFDFNNSDCNSFWFKINTLAF